jgi:hypothetical protein
MISRPRSVWRKFLGILFVLIAVACHSERIECWGAVHPGNLHSDGAEVLEKARLASRSYCSEVGTGCNFSVKKEAGGWSVTASKMLEVDGKCVSRIGDKQFYNYDAAGEPTGVTGSY